MLCVQMDVTGYDSVEINNKLMWTEATFLLLGPSGMGKSHTILTALSNPGRYMDLPKEGAHLWVFPGASLKLQSELEAVLDRNVFKKVRFVNQRIGECTELREALKENNGKMCQVIILDDYMTYSSRDAVFMKELMMHYKRHQRLCFLVATHQLRKDKTGITYDLLDHADRIMFCRGSKNLPNLRSFSVRRDAAPASRQAMVSEFAGSGNRSRYGLCVFDSTLCLFIADYYAFEAGAPQKDVYAYEFGCGETKAMKYFLVPSNKLRLVEGQVDRVKQEERKAWSKIVESFKGTPLYEAASGYVYMLREMDSVSLKNGLVLVKQDMRGAIGARQLIKNLSDSSPIQPAVDAFLKRLKDSEGSSLPEILLAKLPSATKRKAAVKRKHSAAAFN